MKGKIFLDTNILVYLSNEDSLFHKTALEKFKQIGAKYGTGKKTPKSITSFNNLKRAKNPGSIPNTNPKK
jgi:predicted nucleic acid-binding protein